MSVGDFPESLSQPMLVGKILVGRLGVVDSEWVWEDLAGGVKT